LSENQKYSEPIADKSPSNLQADCANCFGLCCVALYFSASEGFPTDKDAGQPCINLQPDFRCKVHKNLTEIGLKGCTAFDCFGAGQKVSQVSFGGHDWRAAPESAKQMFQVFLIMRQLHELLWYQADALTFASAHSAHDTIRSMREKTENLTLLDPNSLMELNVDAHRSKVNELLVKTSELVRAEARRGQKPSSGRPRSFGRGADLIGADLRKTDMKGANLRGACLIAANLKGVDLTGADVIGADFRDAVLSGANLTKCLFLTQAQISVAKGDASTKLPPTLTRPIHW